MRSSPPSIVIQLMPQSTTTLTSGCNWQNTWPAAAKEDRVSSLALGPNGMAAITGSSVGTLGNQDFATVVCWENLPEVSIAMVPTGVHLRFTGVPGHSYTVERALTVTGPWSSLATPTAPLDGLIEYLDTNPPVAPVFYRTSAP
jgi:hypothetical protein